MPRTQCICYFDPFERIAEWLSGSVAQVKRERAERERVKRERAEREQAKRVQDGVSLIREAVERFGGVRVQTAAESLRAALTTPELEQVALALATVEREMLGAQLERLRREVERADRLQSEIERLELEPSTMERVLKRAEFVADVAGARGRYCGRRWSAPTGCGRLSGAGAGEAGWAGSSRGSLGRNWCRWLLSCC